MVIKIEFDYPGVQAGGQLRALARHPFFPFPDEGAPKC